MKCHGGVISNLFLGGKKHQYHSMVSIPFSNNTIPTIYSAKCLHISRLRFVVAMQVQHSYTSSADGNDWIFTYSRSHAFRFDGNDWIFTNVVSPLNTDTTVMIYDSCSS